MLSLKIKVNDTDGSKQYTSKVTGEQGWLELTVTRSSERAD